MIIVMDIKMKLYRTGFAGSKNGETDFFGGGEIDGAENHRSFG